MSTVELEKKIDLYVYKLYQLNFDEAKIIDPNLSEVEFEDVNLNTKV